MMPTQWLLDETARWLNHASRDIRAAQLCAAELHAEALYHCQQAAEKFLKGVPDISPEALSKTHELRGRSSCGASG